MKKIFALLLVVILAFGVMSACSKKETPPTQKPTSEPSQTEKPVETEPESPEIQESDEDCFIWDGDWIVGLTEKGRNEEEIVIPKRATLMGEIWNDRDGNEIKAKKVAFANPNITLSEDAFSYSTVEEVVLPENLEVIPKQLFMNALNIKKVVVPASVTIIEDRAFTYCNALETIEGAENVMSIGDSTFMDCYNLKTPPFGDKLESIGPYGFAACGGLIMLNFPSTLKTVGEFAFINSSNIEEVVFAEGVESIGLLSFAGLTGLKTVYLPESLKEIGDGAFENAQPITFHLKKDSTADLEFDKYTLGDKNEKVYR